MANSKKLDTLWYTRCGIPTPLGLAVQLGWVQQEFAADGTVIKSLQESNDPVEQASHFEHTLPHSFRYGGSTPAIWTRARGQDTRVIGISWIDEYQAILSLPRSGIRSVKDLCRRRLGLPAPRAKTVDVARAASLRGFLTALELGGIGYKDVEWVDFVDDITGETPIQAPGTQVRKPRRHSYTLAAHALARGDVDAIYVKDVRGAEAAHLLGLHVVLDIGFHPDPQVHINYCTPRPLTVNGATLREHPDVVERLLARVVEAGQWAKTHPDETVAHVAKEIGWSESWLRFAYTPNFHRNLETTLSEQSIRGLESFKNFLLQWKFIDADFDVRSWIDPTPFNAVQGRIARSA